MDKIKKFLQNILDYYVRLPYLKYLLVFAAIPQQSQFAIDRVAWDPSSPPTFLLIHLFLTGEKDGCFFLLFDDASEESSWRRIFNFSLFQFCSAHAPSFYSQSAIDWKTRIYCNSEEYRKTWWTTMKVTKWSKIWNLMSFLIKLNYLKQNQVKIY